MDDERRSILERVASGELSPAEAARLLDELESRGREAPTATAEPPQAGSEGPARRIRLVCAMGMAEVVGDPAVREAAADGPHLARREGEVLVIEADQQDDWWWGHHGFTFSWLGRYGGDPRIRPPRPGRPPWPHDWWWAPRQLRVRVNPELPLEVEAQAGSIVVRNHRAPLRAAVQAGRATIEGLAAPIELALQAGSVHLRGRIDHGNSRIQCEAGAVRLHLERGSSVRISATSALGPVTFNGQPVREPWTVGTGTGTLDISTTMGSVRVTSEE
jgi:hypothetical protein